MDIIPQKAHFLHPNPKISPLSQFLWLRAKRVHNNDAYIPFFDKEKYEDWTNCYLKKFLSKRPTSHTKTRLPSLHCLKQQRNSIHKLKISYRIRDEPLLKPKTLTAFKHLKSIDIDVPYNEKRKEIPPLQHTKILRQICFLKNLKDLKILICLKSLENAQGICLSRSFPHLRIFHLEILSDYEIIPNPSRIVSFFKDIRNLKHLENFSFEISVLREESIEAFILKTVLSSIHHISAYQIRVRDSSPKINLQIFQEVLPVLDHLSLSWTRDNKPYFPQKGQRELSFEYSNKAAIRQDDLQTAIQAAFSLKTLAINKELSLQLAKTFKFPSGFQSLAIPSLFLENQPFSTEEIAQFRGFIQEAKEIKHWALPLLKINHETALEMKKLYSLPCFKAIKEHSLDMRVDPDCVENQLPVLQELIEPLRNLRSLEKLKLELQNFHSYRFLESIFLCYSNLKFLTLSFNIFTSKKDPIELEIPFEAIPELTSFILQSPDFSKKSAMALMESLCNMKKLREVRMIGNCVIHFEAMAEQFVERMKKIESVSLFELKSSLWGKSFVR